MFSPDDERFQRRYALIQLLLNGITTAMPIAAETYREWCETEEQFADVVEIAGELGLRMYLGPSYRAGINVMKPDGTRDIAWDYARGEDGLKQAVSFVKRFDGAHDGRIRGAFLPCRIETVTLDLLRETKRQADALGCPIKLHAAQGLPGACPDPEAIRQALDRTAGRDRVPGAERRYPARLLHRRAQWR